MINILRVGAYVHLQSHILRFFKNTKFMYKVQSLKNETKPKVKNIEFFSIFVKIRFEKLYTINLRKYLKNMHLVFKRMVHDYIEHFSDVPLHEICELFLYDRK